MKILARKARPYGELTGPEKLKLVNYVDHIAVSQPNVFGKDQSTLASKTDMVSLSINRGKDFLV